MMMIIILLFAAAAGEPPKRLLGWLAIHSVAYDFVLCCANSNINIIIGPLLLLAWRSEHFHNAKDEEEDDDDGYDKCIVHKNLPPVLI